MWKAKLVEPRDKVVFWYTVKHSEAEELADVLYRVYALMITTGTGHGCFFRDPDNGPKVVVVDNPMAFHLSRHFLLKKNLRCCSISKRASIKKVDML